MSVPHGTDSELIAWAQSIRSAAPALISGAKLERLTVDTDPFKPLPKLGLLAPFVARQSEPGPCLESKLPSPPVRPLDDLEPPFVRGKP